MPKGFDYSQFRDRLRNEFERGQSTGDNFILKDRAAVRVLSYTNADGEVRLFKEAPVHFGITKGPIYCAAVSGGYCPVCEAVRLAVASGDADEAKWAKSCEPRRRYLFNIVNMDMPADQQRVQVLQAPFSLKQAILSIYTDPEYEQAVFVEGRDIILTKTGTGLDTEYGAKIRMQKTAFDKTLEQEVFDLDEYVVLEDPEMLKSLLGGRAPEGGPARAAAPARRPAPAAAEEEPPARRTAAPARGGAPARRAAPPPEEEQPFPEDEIDPVTGKPFADAPPPPPRRPAARTARR